MIVFALFEAGAARRVRRSRKLAVPVANDFFAFTIPTLEVEIASLSVEADVTETTALCD